MVEREVFAAINKTWPEWKEHFIEVYELREASGITAGGAGYHGTSNAFDDDITLDESLTQLRRQITLPCRAFRAISRP